MFNFLKMKYYTIEKRTFGDGFLEIKNSFSFLKNNAKCVFIIFCIFMFVSVFKDFIFANSVSFDFSTNKNNLLNGRGNGSTVLYMFSFFLFFMVYFFTIEAFSQLKDDRFSVKDAVYFSFFKLFDYKIYLLSFSVFLFFFLSLRIALIPLIDALPNTTVDNIIDFVTGLSQAAAQSESAIQSFISLDKNNSIILAIKGISIVEVFFYFSVAVCLFVCALAIHFVAFLNVILYEGMTFLESIKASIYFNFKNGLYMFSSSLLVIPLVVVIFIINSLINISFVETSMNSVFELYTIFLLFWIVSKNTTERN